MGRVDRLRSQTMEPLDDSLKTGLEKRYSVGSSFMINRHCFRINRYVNNEEGPVSTSHYFRRFLLIVTKNDKKANTSQKILAQLYHSRNYKMLVASISMKRKVNSEG